MAKKRRRKAGPTADPDAEAEPSLAPAPAVGTSIGSLLERAGLGKLKPEPRPKRTNSATTAAPIASASKLALPPLPPAPAPLPHPLLHSALAKGELSALNAAYSGVQPIRRSKRGRRAAGPVVRRVTAAPDPGDQAARERLGALVAGGVRFEVRWDDGLVQGLRQGAEERALRRLSGASFEPEAKLDLHGMSREAATRAAHEFIRAQHRRGARYLLIIVGKGLHSEDGVGVLADTMARALTQGVAAPLVSAFTTADTRHGGRGALAVMLR